jgi:hypothetical protein
MSGHEALFPIVSETGMAAAPSNSTAILRLQRRGNLPLGYQPPVDVYLPPLEFPSQ